MSKHEFAARLKDARKAARLSQGAAAKLAGIKQPTLSQLENAMYDQSVATVDLAGAYGVNPTWLATGKGPRTAGGGRSGGGLPSQQEPGNPGVTTESIDLANSVTISQYDTGGRMGSAGVELRDQPGVIESWRVSREWLEKNVRGFSTPDALCIVTGFGDSMRPMFNPGDPLIVDASVHAVEFDAVYFFRVGNEGFIKRLQRVPGKGLLAISENNAYRDWVVDQAMDFEVFGRVLKVWRSEDF